MDPADVARSLRSLVTTPSRRGVARAVAGFAIAGALSPLFGHDGLEAKKKHKKKGKKCPKVDRCPQRYCCQCSGISCDLIDATGDPRAACEAHCASLGLTLTASAETDGGSATFCDVAQQCVTVNCPVA